MLGFERRAPLGNATGKQDGAADRLHSKVTTSPQLSPPIEIPVFAHDFSKIPVHSGAPPDATFVAVQSVETLEHKLAAINRHAEEEIAKWNQQSIGSIADADEFSLMKKKVEADKKSNEDQYGRYWGLFFFWTRGGGQEGEDSPLWKILPAGRHLRRHTVYPAPRYPTAPAVTQPRLPHVPSTETGK